MSVESITTVKLAADDVVKIGAGTYRGCHARIRKVYARMVDVALVKNAQGIRLEREVCVTLLLHDVELEIVSKAPRGR